MPVGTSVGNKLGELLHAQLLSAGSEVNAVGAFVSSHNLDVADVHPGADIGLDAGPGHDRLGGGGIIFEVVRAGHFSDQLGQLAGAVIAIDGFADLGFVGIAQVVYLLKASCFEASRVDIL